jgi:hypothetical protein
MQDGTQRLLVPINGGDAQQMLGGIGKTYLYELIGAGEITMVKLGKRSFVTVDSIRAYVDRLASQPVDAA